MRVADLEDLLSMRANCFVKQNKDGSYEIQREKKLFGKGDIILDSDYKSMIGNCNKQGFHTFPFELYNRLTDDKNFYIIFGTTSIEKVKMGYAKIEYVASADDKTRTNHINEAYRFTLKDDFMMLLTLLGTMYKYVTFGPCNHYEFSDESKVLTEKDDDSVLDPIYKLKNDVDGRIKL